MEVIPGVPAENQHLSIMDGKELSQSACHGSELRLA